jgi:hypothetical protein
MSMFQPLLPKDIRAGQVVWIWSKRDLAKARNEVMASRWIVETGDDALVLVTNELGEQYDIRWDSAYSMWSRQVYYCTRYPCVDCRVCVRFHLSVVPPPLLLGCSNPP